MFMLIVAAGACSTADDAATTTTAPASTSTTEFVPGTLPDAAIARYESGDLGFCIGYPIDWTVDEELDQGIVGFTGQSIPGDQFIENYNIAVVDVDEDMDVERYAALDAPRLAVGVEEYQVVGAGETTVDGVPAITVVFDGVASGVPLRFFRLVVVRDLQAYEFTFAASRDEFENFLPVVDQMLSGLEFVS